VIKEKVQRDKRTEYLFPLFCLEYKRKVLGNELRTVPMYSYMLAMAAKNDVYILRQNVLKII
jgi:hypothetical protein